jgi:uncharacterized protein
MPLNTSDDIGRLLAAVKTIAVVGLSNHPMRPSYGVSSYMQQQGYRIIPVNPTISEALGQRSYPDLSSVPDKIDLVNVFRRPEYVPAVVDESIRLNLPAIWLQEGVIHPDAARRAQEAGLSVVMDRCILKEHRRRQL